VVWRRQEMFCGCSRSQCKILIAPEEGWFGQPKYCTPSKNQFTLCRFMLLYTSRKPVGVTIANALLGKN